jgi:UDP-N-acetylmuramate dehydrogenase
MQKLWILRKATQPLGRENAAYVFKDPVGSSAASLIEQAKLQGTRIGDAEIGDRFTNFILAGPKATSDDVIRLVELVRDNVRDRLGVELESSLEVW